jgi:hypothetical protein
MNYNFLHLLLRFYVCVYMHCHKLNPVNADTISSNAATLGVTRLLRRKVEKQGERLFTKMKQS